MIVLSDNGPSNTRGPSGSQSVPSVTQTQGTADNAAAAGISLAAVLLGVVLLAVVVGWAVGRNRRRQPPAPPHEGRPFANP